MTADDSDDTVIRPAPPTGVLRRTTGWFDERLNVGAFYRKYGRKVFPIHSTFFLGEMALFAFVILVATGIYLALIYVPSNADVMVEGETLPEAYASVRLIESIPVGNLFRNTHHWAAHVMVASILLHTLRIFFTGTYRKPRELNWIVGVVLLILTLGAGFFGYALPYDSYAVTATGIGYSIARSIPWVGEVVSELFFGGPFPTLGSLSRMYTLHVFVIPLAIMALIGIHLLILIKQKHTQPGYARRQAEPGKVLGVPLLPYQALLAGQLLFLMFGVLFLLSAFVPPHPLSEYGPPGPETPEVKPDWYLLWIYGFLKIVPPEASFTLFGATIGANFLGGVLFPTLLFGLLTFAPFLDRTNRRVIGTYEYLEPVRQAPWRLASGIAALTLIGVLFIAAYYDSLGLTLSQIWAIVLLAPLVGGVLAYLGARGTAPRQRFDPRSSPLPIAEVAETPQAAVLPVSAPGPEPQPESTPLAQPLVSSETAASDGDRPRRPRAQRQLMPFPTIAARGERARDNIVATLHELGELAPLVRQTDNPEELMEVLSHLDALRLELAESNQILQGVVRAEED